MPYKTGKMKGELTTTEIRKLIRAHNILMSIKIPKGAKREDIIKLVEQKGFKVDHNKQALIPKSRPRLTEVKIGKTEKKRGKGKAIGTDDILPKPKTKEEKEKAKKLRDEKKKEKEDKIKAEGVKQGAALQRVISKRKKVTTSKKEDEVRPKEKSGRPRVDPTKIKVIVPKKKEESKPKTKKKVEK